MTAVYVLACVAAVWFAVLPVVGAAVLIRISQPTDFDLWESELVS